MLKGQTAYEEEKVRICKRLWRWKRLRKGTDRCKSLLAGVPLIHPRSLARNPDFEWWYPAGGWKEDLVRASMADYGAAVPRKVAPSAAAARMRDCHGASAGGLVSCQKSVA